MTNLTDKLKLGGRATSVAGVSVYAAKTQHGADVSVVRLEDRVEPRATQIFEGIIRHGACGGLEVEQADNEVIVASPSCAGTVAHLPSLGWRLSERLEVFQEIALIVCNFHQRGLHVGALDPAHILLDDDLRPFILGPEIAPSAGPYAAPESAHSGRNDRFSDIFALGRLLHFILKQDTPTTINADPAPLKDLVTFPAGLSRIIRKAVRRSPGMRYASVEAMLEDVAHYGLYEEVGIAHADTKEKNLGGMTYRPPPRVLEAVRRSTLAPPMLSLPTDLRDVQPFKLRQGVRLGLLAGGIISVVTAFVLSYFAGGAAWVRALLGVAAGLVGFAAFNPGMERESSLRVVFATVFASAIFAWNPAPHLAKMAQLAGLHSSDEETRVESFDELSARGVVEYARVDLSGANLRGRRFHFSKMDNAILENADLGGSRFYYARLDGTRMSGAKLHGASFVGTPVENTIDFEKAICDAATALPEGWVCDGKHPKRGHGQTQNHASTAQLGRSSP